MTKGTRIDDNEVYWAKRDTEPGMVWVRLHSGKEYRLAKSEYKKLCMEGWIVV